MMKIFNAKNPLGLSEYLSGNVDLDKVIHKTKFTGLDVITGGMPTIEATSLLDSTKMRVLLPTLQKYYDLVIIDTPAVLAVSDASVIVPLVDGVLLIVKQAFIRKEKLEAALEQVAIVKGKIIGIVINNAEFTDQYYRYNRKKSKF